MTEGAATRLQSRDRRSYTRRCAYQRRGCALSDAMTIGEEVSSLRRDETWVTARVDVSVGVDLVEVHRLARLAAEPMGLAGVLTERESSYRQPAPSRRAHRCAVCRQGGGPEGLRHRPGGRHPLDRRRDPQAAGRPAHRHAPWGGRGAAARRGLRRIDVSLSHTDDLAIAHAVALWADASEPFAL